MLKLYQKFRQIHTRSGDIYDMPPHVTKEQIAELVATSRLIDVWDELLPVDQIKSIKLSTIADWVDLTIANMSEPLKSQARHFVTQRRKEWLTVNGSVLENFILDKTNARNND